MWTLEKKFRFEAAHRLPLHDGKCKRLHGHSWRGALIIQGDKLRDDGPETSMVIDFGRINDSMQLMIDEYLDHHYLNDTLAFLAPDMPTSEVVARWIYQHMKIRVPDLVAVRIEETCTCSCEYRP